MNVTRIETLAMPQGLRVVTARMPGFLSASVGVFVDVGTRGELENESGLAHFLEHMAFKGTTTRTAAQIANEVEHLGSYMNAYTSLDMTAFYIQGLGRNVPKAIEILGDVISNSIFSAAELDIERGVILQEMAQYKDSPDSLAYEGLLRVVFPDQIAGRPILGTPHFVRSAQSSDFLSFMRRHYNTANIVVVAAGDVEHQMVVEEVSKHFAGVAPGPQHQPEKPVFIGGYDRSHAERFEQANALISFPVPSVSEEGWLHAAIAASALGAGMSSPLWTEVREKRGLVYAVGSFTWQTRDYGMFIANMGMTPENVDECFDVSCNVIAKAADGLRDEDVLRAKNAQAFAIAAEQERPFRVAEAVASDLFTFGRIQQPDERIKDVDAVSTEDARAALRKMLTGHYAMSLVGPAPDYEYWRYPKAIRLP